MESLRPTAAASFEMQQTSSSSIWQRIPRLAKALGVLVTGFLILTSIQLPGVYKSTPSHSTTKTKIHSSNFGGLNNILQPGGAKAHKEGLGIANSHIFVPTSNLGNAVNSLSKENIINHYGHYLHDEHRSPYASHLYDKPKEFLQEQQVKFEEKMKKVREEWGAWTDIEPTDGGPERPIVEFDDGYRDLPISNFPMGSWQTDENYVSKFLAEARALVTRVKEGIMAEYGHPLKLQNGTTLSVEAKQERDSKFGFSIIEPPRGDKFDGIGFLTPHAQKGLVRKLLHSLITNDDFYVVLAGHSAAAGHGNNFVQASVLTFHKVMEPVMDKLGIRLISRNMAMGGVGTGQFSLAGKNLYGEADIMLWDSGMTEKGGIIDFFNKQAILSGSRLPVLLTKKRFNLLQETQGKAWVGSLKVDTGILPLTKDEVQVDELPYATRFMNVAEGHLSKMEKFNSVCWEDRKDVIPDHDQGDHPNGQASWHPGFRNHQYKGRILALLVLEGLLWAFDTWEEGIQQDGFPLADKYWHVEEAYKDVRETLRTHINKEDSESACDGVLPYMPRICRVAMQGYGMWTPRATKEFDLLHLIEKAPNGYKPDYPEEMQYEGIDLLPLSQAIPDGHVDVHAIAIATNNPAPDLDHEWIDEDDDENDNATSTNITDSKVPTRRWLRAASQEAWRKGLTNVVNGEEETQQQGDSVDTPASTTITNQRKLQDEQVIPGRGWMYKGDRPTNGFCDGSTMSTCNRDPGDGCLLRGHNDCHKGVSGNSMSGWLVLNVPKVKEGIVLARMEWWCRPHNEITKDWTEVNGGKTTDTTPFNVTRFRRLGKPTKDQLVPKDLKMDIAINGKITTTMNRTEWMWHTRPLSSNCAVWPLVNDPEMAKRENFDGEPMQVAIRFRSDEMPQQGYCLSHIYYA